CSLAADGWSPPPTSTDLFADGIDGADDQSLAPQAARWNRNSDRLGFGDGESLEAVTISLHRLRATDSERVCRRNRPAQEVPHASRNHRPTDTSYHQKPNGADAVLLRVASPHDTSRSRSLSALVCIWWALPDRLLPSAKGTAHVRRRTHARSHAHRPSLST